MVLFWAFLGQILAILRISDQKMTNPFSKENRYSSLDNCLFNLKIGIQVLCNGSNKVTFSFFFVIFIFLLFTGSKKAKKWHFCLLFTLTGPKKRLKRQKLKKQNVTFLDTLHRACIPIFRSNKQFSREE